MCNKKVLLRERKRHTDRGVASTRYAAPGGGGGGTHARGGYPRQVPPAGGRGYPRWAPSCHGGDGGTLGRRPLPERGTPARQAPLPWPRMGYPPPPVPGMGMGYSPVSWMGYHPHLELGWGTPPSAGWGTPPPPRDVNWHTNWKHYLLSYYVRGR